jgi:catechol 2,3-dioxygenase-like lactoylglutathione lyase family enzyme
VLGLPPGDGIGLDRDGFVAFADVAVGDSEVGVVPSPGGLMDWRLEVIVLPVSDVDRALAFYRDVIGFRLDVDHRDGDFRVVQFTPPGSACSVTLMRGPGEPGSVKGLQLVVDDIDHARAELVGRGLEIGEVFHFEHGRQVPGHDPDRADYGTFLRFADPDGNTWLVQEVRGRSLPVRPVEPPGAPRAG